LSQEQASEYGARESMIWSRSEAVNFKLAPSFMIMKAKYYYLPDVVLSRMKCGCMIEKFLIDSMFVE
jgi:hypothetical protein